MGKTNNHTRILLTVERIILNTGDSAFEYESNESLRMILLFSNSLQEGDYPLSDVACGTMVWR